MKKYFASYWIRSAFYTIFQRFSLTFFGFVNFVILTRGLTVTQMGTWALFLAITGIFEATKSNLLKNAHIKYVSSSDDEAERTAVASSSFLINTAITLFFVLLIVVFSGWLGRWFHTGAELAEMLRWFIPGMFFMIFFAHLEAVQQSNLDFKGGFAGSFVRQMLFFGVIVWYRLTKTPISLAYLSMYQSITIGIGTVVLYFYSKKYLLFQFKPSRQWIKKIFGYGGYIFGSGMVANINLNLDQLMTGRFIAPGSVAYYNVASRINLLVDIPSFAAAEVLFPKASQAAAEGTTKVKYLYEKMVAVLLAFTLPTALVIILLPHLITVVIAGPKYALSAPILQMYMVTGIFRPAQNQAANLLNSIGKPKLVFWANTGTLVGFLVINYACLVEFGFYGAAIGTMVTAMVGFVFWYFIMRRHIDMELKNVGQYTLDVYKTAYRMVKGALKKAKANAHS
ncbi:flippase [Flavitalea sp. BT771]|uniref:flippase n=1 Tax=Flavitalea sp. BT771 TaxID=3063329 RepID=UPI0026E2E725|nr:flippase [Flavitalea sp. BT771]MDO6435055.1 flippase [Flavitalea sp. BT771]MDV6223955.1 flippase [Flavitalea sp. BT771]